MEQTGHVDVSADRVWALTFEHSPVGMALVQLDGSWGRVNQSLCRMLGYSSEQLWEMTFQDITHPEDLEEDLDLLAECIAGVRTDYRIVKRYLHADGRLVWGDLSVALVRDDEGRPLHFVSQILDITAHREDRERLESLMGSLESANTDLEQFAAVVSHDLKTPLSAVRASLELLGELLPGDDSAAVLARRAEAGTERMSALIDALLAYTTTSRGTTDGARPVRLGEVVEAALTDVSVLTAGAGVRVELDPRVAAAPPVLAATDLVRTLVVNLLANAVKYRDPARPLTVRFDAHTGPSPDWLTVRVRNDGPSIAEADRERVFGLFERAAGGDASEITGFGIGLAACRRIVAWHGGRIWIGEPASGGVEFAFTLPVA
jgi:PAS domain S-box-containing protein